MCCCALQPWAFGPLGQFTLAHNAVLLAAVHTGIAEIAVTLHMHMGMGFLCQLFKVSCTLLIATCNTS